MNKLIFVILFLIISLLYILDVNKLFGEKFTLVNNIKQFYINKVETANDYLNMYFYQAKSIDKLESENQELRQYKFLYESKNQKLKDIENSINSINQIDEKVLQTRVLSYISFDDFTKVWLDKEKKDDKIEGLIIDDFAAGIVVKKDNKALGLLNGNEKANYAVFIGENEAPGIIHSLGKSKYILAKYIPIWIDIKIGDEVITSGMDNIFYKGLKVGKVVSINKKPDMQEAVIEPYAKVLKRRFFFIYKNSTQDIEAKPEKIQKEDEKKKKN
ncbi:rod shape-determining protein MreC [Arcobacter sp. CECT 8985]|uniref:rod shape-determining protein MreC n=1 Tax=Arcobacter sp. CECT 8985 TaxID=1935424 RepID=UPI00100B3255|nr:rod shape-determining protein MreC [Arcobacter sp. CECT 8985]RXJ85666.1 rod shape-determining protein MreC [Arcobacter sp. CECT 8985]